MALGLVSSMAGCGLEPVGDGGDTPAIPAEVQAAFDESCATSTGCHAAGAPQVVLADPASAEILDKSSSAGGGPLVTLGNVDESYLAQKILGSSGISGAAMPPSPQSDNDDLNSAIIVGWIAGVPLDDGGGGGDGDGDGDGDGSPAPDCYIDPPVPAMPSFATDVWPILEARCALPACHGGSLSPVMGDASAAFDSLVSVPAVGGAMLDYVDPMGADTSYLWHKLLGTQSTVPGGGGASMPVGPAMCTIELQAIYAWITTGASP